MGFCFQAAEGDNATLDCLFEWHARHPEVMCFDVESNRQVEHAEHPEGHRRWNNARYETMVALRNRLLERVSCLAPDRFLSLDSDILLENPKTISELVRLTEAMEVVAPLTYMSPPPREPGDPPGTDFPNTMTWIGPPGNRALRCTPYPIGTLYKADIVMAVVMMTPMVYSKTRYRLHPQGEDLGWSASCAEQGFTLWSASWLYTPHIMHRWQLESYLHSGDPRGSTTCCPS